MAKKEKIVGYTSVDKFEEDIERVDKKLADVGEENIVRHSVVDEINEDMQTIQDRINATEKENRRKRRIRNIKLFGSTILGSIPYVLVVGVVFGLQTWWYDMPIIRQEVMKYAKHEIMMDSTGEVINDLDYIQGVEKTSSVAYLSSKWEKKIDGRYYRTIKEYKFDNHSLEELKSMVVNPNLSIEDAFGKSVNKKVEVQKEIPEEELEKGEYLKIMYRYGDEEDFILEAQDFWPNFWLSIPFVVVSAILCAMVHAFIEDEFNTISDMWDDIRREYNPVAVNQIKKMFEEEKIKITKVSRVTGEEEVVFPTKTQKAK